MQQYILVVEDEPDLRCIYEMTLASSYALDFIIAESGEQALKIINERGIPKIIISDYRMRNGDGLFLHNSIKAKKFNIPFVICSDDPATEIKNKFPDIYGHIEKPRIVGPLLDIIDSVVGGKEFRPFFVPIRISFLVKLQKMNFDLFMKLTDEKFVKVFIDGDNFNGEDADRFFSRNVEYLYIKRDEALSFLSAWDKIADKAKAENPDLDLQSLFIESADALERLIYSCGLTEGMLESAKKAITLAMAFVQKNPDLEMILKSRLASSTSSYRNHIAALTLFNCSFCQYMDWTNETIQLKLALASILHDVALDDYYLEDVREWELKARNLSDVSVETVKFRTHPFEGARIVGALKNVPQDVDKIIIQHHESPDGRGFPKGITAAWITPMSSLFIIVEDFLNFTDVEENMDSRIQEFFVQREDLYVNGSFKKIFDCLKENLKK